MDRLVTCPYCGGEQRMRFIKSYAPTAMKGYFLCESCHSRSPRIRHEYIDGETFTDHFRIGGCARTANAIEEMAMDACGIFAEIPFEDFPEIDEDQLSDVLA